MARGLGRERLAQGKAPPRQGRHGLQMKKRVVSCLSVLSIACGLGALQPGCLEVGPAQAQRGQAGGGQRQGQNGEARGQAFVIGKQEEREVMVRVKALSRYEGRDLRKLSPSATEDFLRQLDRLRRRDYTPAFLCTLRAASGREYMALVELPWKELSEPWHDFRVARLTFFSLFLPFGLAPIDVNMDGYPERSEQTIASACRDFTSAEVQRNVKDLGDLLVITCGEGAGTIRQYYAVNEGPTNNVGGRLALVRIANSTDASIATYYGHPYVRFTVGPLDDDRFAWSAEHMVGVLEKGTTGSKLEVLLWLGTTRGSIEEGESPDQRREAREMAKERGILPALLADPNPWLREAADLVARAGLEPVTKKALGEGDGGAGVDIQGSGDASLHWTLVLTGGDGRGYRRWAYGKACENRLAEQCQK